MKKLNRVVLLASFSTVLLLGQPVSTYAQSTEQDIFAFPESTKTLLSSENTNSSGYLRVKSWGAMEYSYLSDSNDVNQLGNILPSGSEWKYSSTVVVDGVTYYQIATDIWLNSNDSTTYDPSQSPAYQNPSGMYQIQYTQIQPQGNVGYDLYSGVEGVKVALVRGHFGLSNKHTIYDSACINAVKNLQSRVGLPVTGVTDLATWKAMGFSESDWYDIDSYVAPLAINKQSTRSDYVEAMINQARQYLGQPWYSGGSSYPYYGVDCSGLVTQSLYAAGIDTSGYSSIQHAQPGNEWNSRLMWQDNNFQSIRFADRQRGDLIFFTDPSTGVIWHVGILLDGNTMIDSWPSKVQISSIWSNRGNIAGVKRVFY
ncbi:NlpC/P60 family protein [Lactobacillus terrae]|uniref:C40 family peptidase n=1 Tax=Lactobacillus terrae TaxID=2269374 RepID=UPI000C1B7355|nr:NlpC/P60 family protein [Lactobacillus terrae]